MTNGGGEIGGRLREERKRLKLSQEKSAELSGVSRRAYVDWEKGTASPSASALSAMAEHGFDVLYILTGVRAVRADESGPSAAYAHAAMDEVERDYDAEFPRNRGLLGGFAVDPGLPDEARARADKLLARHGDESARRRIEDRQRRRSEALEQARLMVREACFVVDWEPPERLQGALIRLVAASDINSRILEGFLADLALMSRENGGS